MNILRFKQLFLVSGFAGILILLGGQSTHAQSPSTTPEPTDTAELSADLPALKTGATPAPGTVRTSAASLQAETLTAQTTAPSPETTTPETTPIQTITPGRATRSGPSYVGIGGNIGFGGRTDLGRGSFTIFSKVGLTNNISARPAINFNRRPAILLPVTFDFPLRSAVDGRVLVAPFVGGGAVISTGSGSVVRGLVTGGIDVPISDQFTANAAANIGFFGKTEVGLRLGVGYNF
ncbi:hypothetical protein AB3R30_16670 [Leptolyngbyaceae cyanobacterium UHCC 1019]